MRRFLACCLPLPFNEARGVAFVDGLAPDDDGQLPSSASPAATPRARPQQLIQSRSQSQSELQPDLMPVAIIADPTTTAPSTTAPSMTAPSMALPAAPSTGNGAPPWRPSPTHSWSHAGQEQSSVADALLEGVRGLLHSDGGATTTFTNTRTPSEATLLSTPPVLTSPAPSTATTNGGSGILDPQGYRASEADAGDHAAGGGTPPALAASALRPRAAPVHHSGSTAAAGGLALIGGSTHITDTTSSSSPNPSGGSTEEGRQVAAMAGATALVARRRPSPIPRSNRRRTSSTTSTGSSRLLAAGGTASVGSGGGRAASGASVFRLSGHGGGGGGAASTLPPPSSPPPALLPEHAAAARPHTGPDLSLWQPQHRRLSCPPNHPAADVPPVDPHSPAAATATDGELKTTPVLSAADVAAAAVSAPGTSGSSDIGPSPPPVAAADGDVVSVGDETAGLPPRGAARGCVRRAPPRVLASPLLPLMSLPTASELATIKAQPPYCLISGLLADVASAAQPLPLGVGSGRSSLITGVWRSIPVAVKIMCSASLAPDGPILTAARRAGTAGHRHLVNVYGIRTAQVDQASVWTLVPEPRRSSRALAQALAEYWPYAAAAPTPTPLRAAYLAPEAAAAAAAPGPGPGPGPAPPATTPATTTATTTATYTATNSGTRSATLPATATATTASDASRSGCAGTGTGDSSPHKYLSSQHLRPQQGHQEQEPQEQQAEEVGQPADPPGAAAASEPPAPADAPVGSECLGSAAAAAAAGGDPRALAAASTAGPFRPTDPRVVRASRAAAGNAHRPQPAASAAAPLKLSSPSPPPGPPPPPPPQRLVTGPGREVSTSPRRMALAAVRPGPGEHVAALIMDHCEMGDLATLLSMPYNPFRPNRRWPPYMAARAVLRCAREVAAALAHLHRRGIVHGGVKPTNVLLVPARGDLRCFTVKLSDACFSSTFLEDGGPTASSSGLLFSAPEALRHGPSPRADVWAFGLLLLAMVLAPQPPFAGEPTVPLLLRIAETAYRPEWPQPCPAGHFAALLQPLYERCTRPDPGERPSFEQVYLELRTLETRVRSEKRCGSAFGAFGAPAVITPAAAAAAAAVVGRGLEEVVLPPPLPAPPAPLPPDAAGGGPSAAALRRAATAQGGDGGGGADDVDGGGGVEVANAAGVRTSVSTLSATWSGELSGSYQLPPPLPPLPPPSTLLSLPPPATAPHEESSTPQ